MVFVDKARRIFGRALAAFVAVSGSAQTWQVDPGVSPAIVQDNTQLASATFVPTANGQFLVFGNFTHINGTGAFGLARLGVDGQLDPTCAGEQVVNLAPLADGRVLAVVSPAVPVSAPPSVGGEGGAATGTTVVVAPGGYTVSIVRLRVDGRRDETFPRLVCDAFPRLTTSRDGRVIVWGSFRSLGGAPRNGLARLNADGTLDTTFAPALSPAPLAVAAIAPAADGSLVVSGSASEGRGPLTYLFRRVLGNGTVDAQFAPTNPGTTFSLLAVQPDGSVVAGTVSSGLAVPAIPAVPPSGVPEIPVVAGARGSLIRYLPNGALDRTYAPQIPGLKGVTRLEPLPGGRLAVGATVGSASLPYGGPAVFTLGVDGQLLQDWRKVPGAREGQQLLAVQSDGRLLVLQGTLVVASTYYPLPYDAMAPAVATIMPVFLGPTLVETALAISPPDASAAPTTPLTALSTTVVRRQTGSVSRLEADAAGRVLAAGSFTHVDGQPRAGLARFLASGALDAAFAPVAGELLLAPPDGRPILRRTTVGSIDATDGFHRYVTQIVRLQPDGSVDPAFVFPAALEAAKTRWLFAAPDGRQLVAAFEPDDAKEENLKLIWLGADGRRLATLPTVFTDFTRIFVSPAAGARVTQPPPKETTIYPFGPGRTNILDAAQLLADGRLLIAGAFSRVNGIARPALARLNADGSLDTSYAPAATGVVGINFSVMGYQGFALPLSDGRALAFGSAASGGGVRPVAVRYRANGERDAGFLPPDDTIGSGTRALADGSFFYNGRRFDADGWPDLYFRPALTLGSGNGAAYTAVVTADGRIWLGGAFDGANGMTKAGLARLAPRDLADIVVVPPSQRVPAGRDAYLQAAAGTTQPTAWRWTHDGVTIPGATSPKLRLPAVRASDAGVYRAVATVGTQTLVSGSSSLVITPNTSRLTNFSARSIVSPAVPPQVAGVVTSASLSRSVLLRAIGRGLPGSSGVPLLGLPVLTLYENGRLVAENRGGATTPAIAMLASSLGAFAVDPAVGPGVPVAALGAALNPIFGSANYTAVTTSGDGTTGVSLFEFYDTATEGAPALVRNLAIRGNTAPGAGVLTGGFVVAGSGPLTLLVRAVGPTLAAFGLEGAIADPRLDIFFGSLSAFATNAGWGNDAVLADAARRAGAFALPANSRDAALLVKLEPGTYTAQLASVSGATGIGMIEIYVLGN